MANGRRTQHTDNIDAHISYIYSYVCEAILTLCRALIHSHADTDTYDMEFVEFKTDYGFPFEHAGCPRLQDANRPLSTDNERHNLRISFGERLECCWTNSCKIILIIINLFERIIHRSSRNYFAEHCWAYKSCDGGTGRGRRSSLCRTRMPVTRIQVNSASFVHFFFFCDFTMSLCRYQKNLFSFLYNNSLLTDEFKIAIEIGYSSASASNTPCS